MAAGTPAVVSLSPGFPASFSVSSSDLKFGDPGNAPSSGPVSGASSPLYFLFSSSCLIPGLANPSCEFHQQVFEESKQLVESLRSVRATTSCPALESH